MASTKKTFVAVATAIAGHKDSPDSYALRRLTPLQAAEGMREVIVYSLASVFAKENPDFNRAKFLKACEMRNPVQPMVVSIGYVRDDGDLAVLATLNNLDDHLERQQFVELVACTLAFYIGNPASAITGDVKAYVREDATDYVTVGEGGLVEWESEQ